MSLSKLIIYKSNSEIIDFLKTKPKLNIIDEYGYTPLIQAAILNSISKTKILLDAGAKIDFTDLTGRTALFWAADNNNIELCELLLKNGANPNNYSSGGQPILVMPLMKGHQKVKTLLVENGAKLSFAQDFINTKLIGHSFELEGRVDIVDTKNTFIEIELEGFYIRFTLEIITKSLIDFKNSYAGKKMRPYFEHLDKIIKALSASIELIRFQHYLTNIKQFLDKINSLLEEEILILPISFGGHAITLTKFLNHLIRCDRGEYGVKNGTVIYYDMEQPNRFTKTFCRELLYKRQSINYINNGLANYIELTPQKTLELDPQKTGNCSWANAEAVIPAIMFLLLLNEKGDTDEAKCKIDALNFYNEWREWNKARSLDFCIQSLADSTPSRKASKIALLTSILFQSCNYEDKNDRIKSNKILAILDKPEYREALKCYAKTFIKDKDSKLWKNFCNHLEDAGINLDELLK